MDTDALALARVSYAQKGGEAEGGSWCVGWAGGRGGCPALGQGNSAWTVLIIPEMQSQFISREGKVVLLSERISLPGGVVSRCREALGGASLATNFKPHRCLYGRCDGDPSPF